MKNHGFIARAAVGALGGVLLLGSAGAAFAASVDNDDVDVNVNITPSETGALTLSVASNSTTLTEDPNPEAGFREFSGTLPTVTVTDTRQNVPEGLYWYVVGQSTALTSGANSIAPENLGWSPELLTGDDGFVSVGDETVPALDDPTLPTGNNVGLAGEELLALNIDSAGANPTGEWTANAGLKLKTEDTVVPGSYTGTITLTLWEDAQ